MRTFFVAAAVAIGVSVMAQSDPAAEVLAFEREVEAAIVRGDVEFMERACAPTFVFSHGDGWTTGGDPFRVDSFVFRTLAGVAFSALYVFRGFGITAWTHALYDVLVLIF